MRAAELLAAPWTALHRSPDRIRAATFGTFDGATSSYGVTFAMFAQHRPPAAFAAPIIGLAIASAAGMGGGEAASAEGSDLGGRAVVMAVASIFGGGRRGAAVLLPAPCGGAPAHLSDNVVAIALTLPVFQLKVPATTLVADQDSAADLAAQLAKQAGQLIGYLVAFYVVAQFWLAHHRVFRRAAGHHEGLA